MLSMESTSNRMTRLGKSLITDTELLSFERIIAEIEAVEPERSPSSRAPVRAREAFDLRHRAGRASFRAAARRINPAARRARAA